MAQLVLFSGACHSGKTTTMTEMKRQLEANGKNVIILHENIREELDRLGMTIDEIREAPSAYLKLQERINTARMERETAAWKDNCPSNIYLEDRAITDCMYYMENYINKNELQISDLITYSKLYTQMNNHAINYNLWPTWLLTFKPIEYKTNENNKNDKYRPVHLPYLNQYEYLCIRRLNVYYAQRRMIDLDLNNLLSKRQLNLLINKIL